MKKRSVSNGESETGYKPYASEDAARSAKVLHDAYVLSQSVTELERELELNRTEAGPEFGRVVYGDDQFYAVLIEMLRRSLQGLVLLREQRKLQDSQGAVVDRKVRFG